MSFNGYIDSEYLRESVTSFDGYFYICGPQPMMDAVEDSLKKIGIKDDQIVKEVFLYSILIVLKAYFNDINP